MIAVATDGPRIQAVDDEYQTRRAKIRDGLAEREIEEPNPFDDLWAWYGKWSGCDLPTYQSRRQFISELYAPVLNRIRAEEAGRRGVLEVAPTGWVRVDRGIHEARQRLSIAETEEQFQAVGLICREALISLGQTVFDPENHPTHDGVAASKTDAKRMLTPTLQQLSQAPQMMLPVAMRKLLSTWLTSYNTTALRTSLTLRFAKKRRLPWSISLR